MPAIHDALPNTAIGALRVSPGYDRAFPSIENCGLRSEPLAAS